MSADHGLQALHDGVAWARVCDLGGFSVDVVEVQAGATETLIVHHECDEAWYVLSGELVALIGGSHRIVSTGDWVRVPRGTAHGSRNESETTVRLLVVNAPPWSPEHDHPVDR